MKSQLNITVRGYHIDYFGHVNHARYVEFLEEARWHYLEENQLFDWIHEIGAAHVVSHVSVTYLYPAGVGNILSIETGVSSRGTNEFDMAQTITCPALDRPVVKARVTNVFVDAKGRPRPIDRQILNIWPDLAMTPKRPDLRNSSPHDL